MQAIHKELKFLTHDKQFVKELLFKGNSNMAPHFYNPVYTIIFCKLYII